MILHRFALAIPLLALALATAPARAEFTNNCPITGCVIDPADSPSGDGTFDFDYTVPPDGIAYRWAIDFTSTDPFTTVTLGVPTQTEVFTIVRTATGFDEIYDPNPPYTFIPNITPGRSTWLVRAPRAYDNCAQPGPVGQACAAIVNIWGNGTMLTINGTAPITAFFSETAVPEPATWATLLLGFTLTGLAVRRRRVVAG